MHKYETLTHMSVLTFKVQVDSNVLTTTQIGLVCAAACTCLLCGCQAILCSAEDAADKTELINGELGSF